uniref:Uncharacterized protein n=1 Tax=Micrurus surinamensis TaxID=129470 RepID=A0A2D4P243_MICSU
MDLCSCSFGSENKLWPLLWHVWEDILQRTVFQTEILHLKIFIPTGSSTVSIFIPHRGILSLDQLLFFLCFWFSVANTRVVRLYNADILYRTAINLDVLQSLVHNTTYFMALLGR